MRISRLYLPVPLASGADVVLDGERAHYLRTVLRLKRGFDLTVFNGEGGEFAARIGVCHREAVSLTVGEHRPDDRESRLDVRLGLGISRGERMDLAIQKAVELGVGAITPLFTERCVVQLDGERKAQRLEHWRRVVWAACEQSGRNRVPEVLEPRSLEAWLPEAAGLRICLDPHAVHSLRELAPPVGSVTLLSGPEGGFSDAERAMAVAAAFVPIRLGPRVLRTETAALAALAAIQTLWGDMAV
ncbi:Ribosomal RNA small subunit methyltransferase E [Methylococcus capsulatus]|jgi:16S rRNA (uracil1498-N3)-methyltransferase|uniref:Ribosomal RNA small subunit methyltransferase E n=1 Tax=Methylococcus capsulatus TaxID=414 RepID=A0AA35UZ85_METCP|nr:16S rRNA (uracil(1498)-N(3))-methyltransferase [Methylococcus capsulatus]CAI8789531.1 Ribosomal RNA small subunit methyltransferase E [Methylococcus capsulatus]